MLAILATAAVKLILYLKLFYNARIDEACKQYYSTKAISHRLKVERPMADGCL